MSLTRLYHGTTSDFGTVDVNEGRGYKDFGKGFYLAADRDHAVRLALRNKAFLEKKSYKNTPRTVTAYLYEFDFDFSLLNRFNSKVFETADFEWIKFVLANRDCETKAHDYDIVTGPTADDLTNASIQTYYSGLYGEQGSDKALTTLIQMLETENLSTQIYFGNQAAANELIFVKRSRI